MMTPEQIAATLPAGKTYAEALQRATRKRQIIWDTPDYYDDEDLMILALDEFCTRLCGGNAEAGAALATDAIWNAEVAA